ncbi:hypothetical protein [Bosea sp. (in: a-proteobacteria)]|uniref:hypothetical protein n=1 Tax=Bosea sp. (in: a-proteobacteria) TaxID=1871050 RepID=UPI0031FE460E
MEYRLYGAVEVLGDFTIPEAQDAIAMCGQIGRSCGIMGLRCGKSVLVAVEFDHEFGVEVRKVREIGTHRCLSAEVASREFE